VQPFIHSSFSYLLKGITLCLHICANILELKGKVATAYAMKAYMGSRSIAP
jgi:hypothetical protein